MFVCGYVNFRFKCLFVIENILMTFYPSLKTIIFVFDSILNQAYQSPRIVSLML